MRRSTIRSDSLAWQNCISPSSQSLNRACDGLLKIAAPTTVNELHSVCTANSYIRFVQRFGTVSEPIRYLLRKAVPWIRTSEWERAFKPVKKEIGSNRVLARLDENAPTLLSKDA